MIEEIQKKYVVETRSIQHGEEYRDTLEVTVLRVEGDHKRRIGSYPRNYPHLYNTFYPFLRDGQEFALYSSDYTATRVMELPSCKDIAGEERNPYAICPLDYFVPYDPENGLTGQFGFVGGIFWGDEGCLSIKLLDLSQVKKGIIRDNGIFYQEEDSDFHIEDDRLKDFLESGLEINRAYNGFNITFAGKTKHLVLSEIL